MSRCVVKASELIRLLAVVILSATLLGLAGYALPALNRLAQEATSPHTDISTHVLNRENGLFSEHALLQQRYADTLKTQIITLLEKTLGAGHVDATVQVELDLQQETRQKREPLAETRVAVRQVVRRNEGGAFVDESALSEEETAYDVASRSEEVVSTSGAVKRLSVSILIDGSQKKTGSGDWVYQPRSTAEMQRYRRLVEALIGFSPERGDTLDIQNMPFAARPAVWSRLSLEMTVRLVFLGACFLLMAFLLIRYIFPMMRVLVSSEEAESALLERGRGLPNTSDILSIQRFFREKPEAALSLLKNWLYEPSPKKRRGADYTAQQKAAILLLALGETTIRDVFKRLSEMEVRTLSRLMSRLGSVRADDVRAVLTAFLRAVKEPVALFGTEARVRQVLSDVFSPEKSAAMMVDVACHNGQDETIWARLERLDVAILARYLEPKKAETAALILYHLPNDKAAKILSLLSDEAAAGVLAALSQLEQVPAAERLKLEEELTQQLHNLMLQARFKSGSEKASDILRSMDHASEEKLMTSVYHRAPMSAEQIASHMIRFDDIARWQDSAIQTILRHTNRDVAALALRGASTPVRDAFARNMPPQVWASLMRESERMRAPRLGDIERAQNTITKTAQELIYHKKVSPFASKGAR